MIVLYGPARSPNIFYKCGFNSDAECIYLERNSKKILFVPGFEYFRALKEVTEKNIIIKQLVGFDDVKKEIISKPVSDHKMPLYIAKKLGITIADKKIFAERRIKTPDEIKKISESQRIAEKAILYAKEIVDSHTLKNGVLQRKGVVLTSQHLRYKIRCFLINNSFDCPDVIVSSARQTAQPHNRGDGPIREGPLIIDVFPQSERTRYFGDMTRTFIIGDDERAKKMLFAVQKAHDICVQRCVPKARISDIHSFCLSELEKEGFNTTKDKGMIHSLGHGVGLDIHEAPLISASNDGLLEEGDVVTIEPGLYYDVGVRWENIVVVGEKPIIL